MSTCRFLGVGLLFQRVGDFILNPEVGFDSEAMSETQDGRGPAYLPERPCGVSAYECFRIFKRTNECGNGRAIPAVAKGYGCITKQAAPLCSLNGASSKLK